MTGPENHQRPRLEIVRNREDLSEDEKVIEAYCDELLIDKDGLPRDFAFRGWTPFAHSTRDWSRVIFRRSGEGYTISCYGEDTKLDPLIEMPHGEPVFEVEMQPYQEVYPGYKAPAGVKWCIQAGRPGLGGPTEIRYEPAYFRGWLEEIWGPLPRLVQKRLGITGSSNEPSD